MHANRGTFPESERRNGWRAWRLSKRVSYYTKVIDRLAIPSPYSLLKIIMATYNGWVVSKGRIWMDEMTMALIRLADGGIVRMLVRRHIEPRFRQKSELQAGMARSNLMANNRYLLKDDDSAVPGPFEFAHLAGGFFVLGFGLVVAVLAFAFFEAFRSKKAGRPKIVLKVDLNVGPNTQK